MKKRVLSAVLVLCMALNLLPMDAFAVDNTGFAEPQVTKLTVSFDDGEPVELLGNQPTVSMPVGGKPVFTVQFDNTDLLNQVFVTSTKDGETKYLEAKLSGDQYVTEGYFDSADTNYIPGTIAVMYTKKAVKIDESGNIGGVDLSTLKTQLTAQGVSCRNEMTDGDGTVTAQIVLGDTFGSMADVYFDVAVSEFIAGAGIDQGELDKWLGVYQNLSELSSYDLGSADGKQFTLYLGDGKDFGDSDTYLVMLKDATSNKYTKTILRKAADKAGLGDISDTLSAANVVSKKLLEYSAISKETAALREEIEAHPTLTPQEKAEATAQADALDRDKKLFLIGMTAVSLLAPPASAPLMISALVAGYSTMADYFWDYRIGMIQGCDPVKGVFSNDDYESGGIPLSNAYIEKNGTIIESDGKYYLAENIDDSKWFSIGWDAYDKFITANVTIDLNGHTCSQFSVTAGSTLHVYDSKYNEAAGSSGNNGKTGLSVIKGSHAYVENCVIGSKFSAGFLGVDDSSLTIFSGIIDSQIGIEKTSSVTMVGGTCSYKVNNGGHLSITGATINHITNSANGTATISNAIISSIENSGTNVVIGGSMIGSIDNWGEMTINAETHVSSGIENRGELMIKDGTISSKDNAAISNSAGKLIIDGGIIETIVTGESAFGSCLYINGGDVTINGGTIRALGNTSGISFSGLNDGALCINGGTISGEKGVTWLRGDVVISGGKIIGRKDGLNFGGQWQPKLILKIQADTVIEIIGNSKAVNSFSSYSNPIEIDAKNNYTGNLTYYDAPDADGVSMTLQEARKIDLMQPYVCLVADDATGGPSGENPSDCEHTYTALTTAPTCIDDGYITYICTSCGESYTDNRTAPLGHSYGEWIITIPATATTNGRQERTCFRCGDKQVQTIPATGTTSTPGGSSYNDSSSNDDSYSISAPTRLVGGTVTVRPTSADEGTQVTITTTPKGGYEVNTVTVKDKNGHTLSVTNTGSGKYTFTMPKGKVDVDVTFARIQTSPTISSFDDVAANAYYVNAVAWAVEQGITSGTSATTFSPNAICTRAQMITFLWRAAGSPISTGNSNPFTDVEPGTYYYDAVLWAVEQGITSGATATTFNPSATVSRSQTVSFLYRAAGSPAANGANTFVDVSDDAYYAPAVQWAAEKGITTGTNTTTFSPNNGCTRGQIVTFLHRNRTN